MQHFQLKTKKVRRTHKYSTNYPNQNQFNELIRWSVIFARMIQLNIFRFFLCEMGFFKLRSLFPEKTQFGKKILFSLSSLIHRFWKIIWNIFLLFYPRQHWKWANCNGASFMGLLRAKKIAKNGWKTVLTKNRSHFVILNFFIHLHRLDILKTWSIG